MSRALLALVPGFAEHRPALVSNLAVALAVLGRVSEAATSGIRSEKLSMPAKHVLLDQMHKWSLAGGACSTRG
jgi:hypothetical protein